MNNDDIVDLAVKLLAHEIHTCEFCGYSSTEDDEVNSVNFTSDPFASEIYGDNTEYWICDDCYKESVMDI